MMQSKDMPVSCGLATADAVGQIVEWKELEAEALNITVLPRGVRMRFPLALKDSVSDLVRREAACCAFLDFEVIVDGAEFSLDVTSENPDALPVIFAIVGAEQP